MGEIVLINASPMSKLFVDESIEINAPAGSVWEVLTEREYTTKWATEFSGGSPFHIESDWKLGSPVLWKDSENKTIVEGNVTALETQKLLCFTVFDTRSERPPVTEKDGITYQLSQENSKTRLRVSQGDFSVMPDGKKYRDMSAEIWNRVLPKVKELAERTNL
jgi:uncharacterized protein YndB with AHSA1/START domain